MIPSFPHLGDLLCEIQTDKAVVGFELEEEGFLAKILVPLDAKAIAVGQPIAIIVDSAEDIAKAAVATVAAPSPTAAAAPSPTAAAAAAPSPPAAAAPVAAPAAAPAAPVAAAAPVATAPAPAAAHGPEVYTGQIEKYGPAVRMLLQLYG